MNIINGQDVFGAQTLTTNFPMKVVDIDFFSPPQSITLGQEEDHYSTLLHLNINEQSLNGEDDDSLIIYIVIKQDNGNILQYPIYAPEGVLNVTNYGIKISKTEYYFPVVSTMTDHPHNGTIQFRIHAAAMVTDDPEDREGALIAASSKIKYRVDDSIAFNANVPSKFYDRFLEPSSGIVTPEMFQRADNAPQYTDDMLINMALKSNAKVVLMIGDYVLDSPIIIAGPTYQPKTIFHKGSITYTGKKILEKYGRDPDNSNWTISPYSVRLQDSYERTADSIDNIIFNNGIELDIETGLKYTGTSIKVHVYPRTKSAILITDIGSVCNITFDRIESSGDGIEFLSNTIRENVGSSEAGSYLRTAVQYVNLYFGSIMARYGEKIDNNAQVTGPNGNISGGKCIYFNLATIDESQKIPEYDAQQNIIGYHYYGISDIYAGGDNDTKKINGWLNEIRIYDGRLNSGAYGIYADGRTTENRINNVKIQNVALEPNNGPKKNVWVDYTSYLSTDQKRWIEAKNNNQGQNPPSPPPYLGYVEGGPKPSSTSPHFPEMMVFDVTKFSRKINIKDFYLIDVTDNYSDSDTTRYRYVYYQEIPFKKLYRGIYMANGCDRWYFSGLRYAEKPTVPQLMYREWGDQETVGGRYVAYITDESSDNEGKVNEDAEPQDIPTAKFYENAFSRSTQGWLLETVGTVREFLFEGAQYSSDSNFKFSDRTSGTLIMPNSDGETIQIEEGTTKVSHIFASFRTVTDGVVSPFQEAETPYIEDIVYNVNSLQNYIFPVKETVTIDGQSQTQIVDYEDLLVTTKRSFNTNAPKFWTRVFRGDSYDTVLPDTTRKTYTSIYGNIELEDGLYKIELETLHYDNNYDKSFKNTYYFKKTFDNIEFLPARRYVLSDSEFSDWEEWELGILSKEEIGDYTPVIKRISNDFISNEWNDEIQNSDFKDNYRLIVKGLLNVNIDDQSSSISNEIIKTTTYKLSYHTYEKEIFMEELYNTVLWDVQQITNSNNEVIGVIIPRLFAGNQYINKNYSVVLGAEKQIEGIYNIKLDYNSNINEYYVIKIDNNFSILRTSNIELDYNIPILIELIDDHISGEYSQETPPSSNKTIGITTYGRTKLPDEYALKSVSTIISTSPKQIQISVKKLSLKQSILFLLKLAIRNEEYFDTIGTRLNTLEDLDIGTRLGNLEGLNIDSRLGDLEALNIESRLLALEQLNS